MVARDRPGCSHIQPFFRAAAQYRPLVTALAGAGLPAFHSDSRQNMGHTEGRAMARAPSMRDQNSSSRSWARRSTTALGGPIMAGTVRTCQ